MKKLLSALLAGVALILVTLLTELSAPALAYYSNGGVCPVCGDTTLHISPGDENEHYIWCEGFQLNGDDCGFSDEEPHHGGTATCTSGPVCEGCYEVYGVALGHDWVVDTGSGDNGWQWDADHSSAKVSIKCRRSGCNESAAAEDNDPAVTKTYSGSTGKVTASYTATIAKDGKTFTDTQAVQYDPIVRRTDLWVAAGTTYTVRPQSVPDACDCHYRLDGWTGPILTSESDVYEENGEFYRDMTYTDTAVYKLDSTLIQRVEAKDATCTEPGNEEYWKCSDCGKMFSDKDAQNEISTPVIIPSKGHKAVDIPAVEATCTAPGVSHGKRCSVCGTLLGGETVSKALGHWFVDWQPNGSGAHSAPCERCRWTMTAECALISLPGTGDSSEQLRICPICGRREGGEALKRVESVKAEGALPDGFLYVFAAQDEGASFLTVCFEKGGKLVQPDGTVTLILPADILDGHSLILADADGPGYAVDATVNDGKAVLTLDFAGGGAPVPAIVLIRGK
ncbi:MAG: hypothetical protein K5784_10485 [Clostridiales bacterium]|nr:hypothetical protein [Clostridiales bacterium]